MVKTKLVAKSDLSGHKEQKGYIYMKVHPVLVCAV